MPTMRFLITGGTGLIGKQIVQDLIKRGDEVHVLSREKKTYNNSSKVKFFHWDPEFGSIDLKSLNGVDIVINLAGTPITQFWTNKTKKSILNSRINSVKILTDAILKNPNNNIKLFLNASAIGIYPSKRGVLMDESFEYISESFLGNVVDSWEKSTMIVEDLKVKTSILRIGLVLSNKSGFLKSICFPTRFYLGCWFGDGNNYYSWIHLDDLVSSIIYIADNKLTGKFNLVSPKPVTSKFFMKKLSSQLEKKIVLPSIPVKIVKFLLGDMSELFLFDQKVSCNKLLKNGFTFKYVKLEDALKNLLHKL